MAPSHAPFAGPLQRGPPGAPTGQSVYWQPEPTYPAVQLHAPAVHAPRPPHSHGTPGVGQAGEAVRGQPSVAQAAPS